jgi:predicted RNA binding protein YcfA (HicA-like mRNA interferase family)
MARFPKDASRPRVVAALEALGFLLIREREHIAMVRVNNDGTKTPLTLPNHKTIKSSTLRVICRQSSISREDFLNAYEQA